MMKKILSLLVWAFACAIAFSQNDLRIAKSKTPLADIQQVVMPMQDNAVLLEEEMQRRGPGIPPRFAVNLETDISPKTHGQWERLANGQAIWRLRILSKGAKSLNLGFTKYKMPRGGSLIIYSPDQELVMGPFTPADNEEHEQLWTPILQGEELVIEVKTPFELKDQLELKLKYVNHDFAGFSQMASGSCNLDVICGEADGWGIVDEYRDIIQSVAVYSLNGSLSCTGFLINNTRQDCTPYFMTANHCGVGSNNAASLVAYWNFQNSTCRQPNSPQSGGNGNGLLNNSNTGSIWRAGWGPSDFTLVELDDPVSETANGFYAGWNAENTAPADTVICIHHPSTDEKRISFEFDPVFISGYLGTTPQANGDHLTVLDWDIGTTEGGSSGSPLFNNKKQVVGQLHGGYAACGNNENDSYGWFHKSWNGGGTPTTRLRDWLDPDNLGLTEIDGRHAAQCSFFVAASPALQEACASDSVSLAISVSENFQNDVELSINALPNGLIATFGSNPLAPGGTTTLVFSNLAALSAGLHSFIITGTDGVESNSSSVLLNVVAGLPPIPNLNSPADQAEDVATIPSFNWSAVANTTYTIEIATDADFTDIVETANGITGSQYQISSPLATTYTYYWRVMGKNACGENDWSAVRSFTTAAILCASMPSTNVPVTIPQFGTPVVSSTILVQSGNTISDVNVHNIEITHTWVSDLRIELTSPEGTTIELMNNVFGGECGEDNVAIGFDDQSPNPYSALDGMCNGSSPALAGVFQPSVPLSTFVGEQAAGLWTLTVFDDFNQDGGSINNWELEICSSIPNDNSVVPSETTFANCTGGASSFNLTLGNAFDETNGVNLSADGLPMGATATFDPNPAPPGSIVNVTLAGANETGDFFIEIIADDGTQTGQTQVQWTISGVPDEPTAIAPAQGAVDVPISSIFSWTAPPTANGYEVELSTNPDFSGPSIFINSTVQEALVSNLMYCTEYYWRVLASNQCGASENATVYSFTTEKDLSFSTTQLNLTTCNVSTVSVPISVGKCFEPDGINLSINGLPANATAVFSSNPVFSNENLEVEITLVNAALGSYPIAINGSDGLNDVSVTFTLEVEGPAAPTTLIEPTNDETEVDVEPLLSWDAVPDVLEYKIEIATDVDFDNMVYETTQSGTSIDLPIMLENLTLYFWRITSINECGAATTAPFSFTTEAANAVVEMDGLQLEILPNPTRGLLQISSSSPISERIGIKVFMANGIQVLEGSMEKGFLKSTVDLTGHPSGVYLLQLTTGQVIKTERIVVSGQ